MMMQFVMISPTKTESCWETSYTNALSTWSAMITRLAMTESWTMMRICEGM